MSLLVTSPRERPMYFELPRVASMMLVSIEETSRMLMASPHAALASKTAAIGCCSGSLTTSG